MIERHRTAVRAPGRIETDDVNANPTITYRRGNDLNLDDVIELYRDSTFGARRPVDNRARMAGMLREANLVITAWDGALLVGLSRSLTDFHYVTYCADLAVRLAYQRKGIGRELLEETRRAAGPEAKLVLLAAPAAEQYYPRIGFKHHPQAWIIGPTDPMR